MTSSVFGPGLKTTDRLILFFDSTYYKELSNCSWSVIIKLKPLTVHQFYMPLLDSRLHEENNLYSQSYKKNRYFLKQFYDWTTHDQTVLDEQKRLLI